MNLKDGILTSELLPALHGFTTRECGNLGYGKNYGDPEVASNRAKLFLQLDANNRIHVQPKQVHSAKAIDADQYTPGIEADASFTNSNRYLLSVLTADCVPILLYHPQHVVAAVHAGWRGLLNGIIPEALLFVPAGATAVIGPSIGVCCYEVSEDLAGDFASKFGEKFVDRNKSKPHLDLAGAASQQLVDHGAKEIEVANMCTRCHGDLFFSYRRDGSSGRQMSFIGL
jgi:YfiH family protein